MKWVDPERLVVALAERHSSVFWLDGQAGRPRRSIVGWLEDGDTALALPAGEEPFQVTRELLTTVRPHEKLVGWFGYAARTDRPALRSATAVPDTLWMHARRYLLFDHDALHVTAVGFDADPALAVPVLDEPPPAPLASVRTWDRSAYVRAFDQVQRELRSGNTYETNLTYRVEVDSEESPITVYRRLRRLNPAPCAAFVQHDGATVLSSSPESFARIQDGWIETRPIKGTTPRGAGAAADAEQARLLHTDSRLRAENLIVTDLLRDDLSRVCEPGTVTVPDLMRIESYASVHQLVTTVRGRLASGVDLIDAIRELSPAGSMTGAPKLRTMQIIADVESTPRGIYSGCLGWLAPDAADLAVVIRTLVHDGTRYVAGTGGGITVTSEATSEWEESEHKLARLLLALGAS